jgi:hypothetical protein
MKKMNKRVDLRITSRDKKFFRMIKLAEGIVLKEDEILLKKLARH